MSAKTYLTENIRIDKNRRYIFIQRRAIDVHYLGSEPWMGVTKPLSPVTLFSEFFDIVKKHTLAIKYHFHIWQVSVQLSCADTYQIWMWFNECNSNCCKIENFAYCEINERSLSNPHRWGAAR